MSEPFEILEDLQLALLSQSQLVVYLTELKAAEVKARALRIQNLAEQESADSAMVRNALASIRDNLASALQWGLSAHGNAIKEARGYCDHTDGQGTSLLVRKDKHTPDTYSLVCAACGFDAGLYWAPEPPAEFVTFNAYCTPAPLEAKEAS